MNEENTNEEKKKIGKRSQCIEIIKGKRCKKTFIVNSYHHDRCKKCSDKRTSEKRRNCSKTYRQRQKELKQNKT